MEVCNWQTVDVDSDSVATRSCSRAMASHDAPPMPALDAGQASMRLRSGKLKFAVAKPAAAPPAPVPPAPLPADPPPPYQWYPSDPLAFEREYRLMNLREREFRLLRS